MKIQCGQFEKVGYQHFENAMLKQGKSAIGSCKACAKRRYGKYRGIKKRGVIVDSLSELLKKIPIKILA